MTLNHDSSLTPADRDHLKILSICFYVYGGLQCLGFLFGVAVYAVVVIGAGSGWIRMSDVETGVFMAVGGCVSCLSLVAVVLHFMAAGALKRRQRFVLIMVAAVLACLNLPLGTVLGVFTIVVLMRPTVKAAFGRA